MKRLCVVVAVVATLLIVPNLSLGASPTPGTVFVGLIKSPPFQMHVSLTVAVSGKKATFTYLCGKQAHLRRSSMCRSTPPATTPKCFRRVRI